MPWATDPTHRRAERAREIQSHFERPAHVGMEAGAQLVGQGTARGPSSRRGDERGGGAHDAGVTGESLATFQAAMMGVAFDPGHRPRGPQPWAGLSQPFRPKLSPAAISPQGDLRPPPGGGASPSPTFSFPESPPLDLRQRPPDVLQSRLDAVPVSAER